MASKKKPSGQKKSYDLYIPTVITRSVILTFTQAGGNVKQYIEKQISNEIQGKCIIEGFVQPNSIKILSYSSGRLQGNNIVFDVVIECNICAPVEGMHIKAVVKNITQAGIRAEVDSSVSPVIIYVSRDHHYDKEYFNKVKEGEKINTRVIGIRYELNDKYISIMSELLEDKSEKYAPKKKPKINIEEDI
jgi:DNA-directed RNA polymerase subunit E'/Rpb7